MHAKVLGRWAVLALQFWCYSLPVQAFEQNFPALAAARKLARTPQRPFRLGTIKLSPTLDHEKPLAAFDPAGFVVNSGLLIGNFRGPWIGGMNLINRRYQWWLEATASLTAPPGSFGSSVVFGLRDGKVLRVDALSGKSLWTANLGAFSERPFLLNGTTLYVMTAAQVLYALDFQSGNVLWLYDAGFPEGLSIRGGARPVFHDNKVIFGTASGELFAVTGDSGKLVWRFNPSYSDARFHDVVGEMVLRGNKLIISRYDGFVAAIDIVGPTRSVLWQQTLPGVTTSVFRGERLYVGSLNGDVYCLDPDNLGQRVWRYVSGVAVTTLTAGESTLFVGGAAGRVTALNLSDGAVQWFDRLGSAIASPAIMDDKTLYFSTGMKQLYAYKIQ